MYNIQLLYFSVAITLTGMAFIAMAHSITKAGPNASIVILNACITSIPALHALSGHPVEYIFGGSSFFGTIPFRIDSLSAWFIQNGKTKAYMLYGLFFILLVILGTIFNFILWN